MNNSAYSCKILTIMVWSFWCLVLLIGSCFAQYDPNSPNQVVVHLFEWKWNDIAAECENFLAPHGYGGVQVSPPNEYVVAMNSDVQRPWWERYQPVSYNIISRSGDQAQFQDMVNRCNNVGVRIYVDAVINHMSGWWPVGTLGVGGTGFNYDQESYPGVPYSAFDFNDANCNSASGGIESYNDANQVRNCRLVGLIDLNQGTAYVRGKIIDYMNSLIDMGVAGFRVDACKHMWPGDLLAIFSGLKDLNTSVFPAGSRPFIFQEVIDMGGEAVSANEYYGNGRITEFKFGEDLSTSFRGNSALKYLVNFGEAWGLMPRQYALVFIDNHDNQRTDPNILTFRSSYLYKMAVAFMLAHPYGYTRVMSSFYWDPSTGMGNDAGPPHDSSYNILSPQFNADLSCQGDWICEHRWRQIYNMVAFRNAVHGTDWNDWWDNGNNKIAFCRGDKGFVAFNKENSDFAETLQTCLPAGTYCDVASGSLEGGSCTGKSVTVGADGTASISIKTTDADGFLAIHVGSKV